MKIEYKNYTAEDFAQDIDFIKWVKHNVKADDWHKFIDENPELTSKIELAKDIVEAFEMKKSAINGADKEIYSKIEYFFHRKHSPKSSFTLWPLLKYAAIFALLLSISYTGYLIFNKENSDYATLTKFDSISNKLNDIQLVLENGKTLTLNNKLSKLEFDESGNTKSVSVDKIISESDESGKNGLAHITIPHGTRLNVFLCDGTEVFLNAGSKLSFPQKFEGATRMVYLEGEAYFKVTKNKKMPFVVNTNNVDVKVLGTEFNVDSRISKNKLEVVLVEGSVRLYEKDNNSKTYKLAPSQKASYDKSKKSTTLESNVDVYKYICWKEGVLQFEKENINTVFAELSDYYNMQFEAESGTNINRSISGKLQLNESFEEVMLALSSAAYLAYRIEDNKVIVRNKSDKLPVIRKN